MKFLKWMTVVLLPIALVACGESDADKVKRLREELKIIIKKVDQCGFQNFGSNGQKGNDESCKEAEERGNQLIKEIHELEAKIIKK